MGRFVDRDTCLALVAQARDRGDTIVFTNGCFDILHVGHVRYLQGARALGNLLVVGLNSDDSVRRLKGANRPINHDADRGEVLAALGAVDLVTIFEEDTPRHLITCVDPDILVKGGDYRPDQVVGREEVEARGGRLVIISLVEGKSTTAILDRIAPEFPKVDPHLTRIPITDQKERDD